MKDERWYNPTYRGFLPSLVLHPSLLILFFFLYLPAALAGQLNINTATEKKLTSLPYIGAARAHAIVQYRRTHGPFRRIEELLKVDTIGPKSLEAVRPYIALSNKQTAPANGQSFTLGRGQTMLLADGQYFPVLINFIQSAQKQIDVAMFLFKTTDSDKNKATKLMRELIRARKRGVLVHVVLEKSGYSESINTSNKQVAATLRKNKIKVRFDSPDKTTHTKMIIIDKRFCFVGSHNLSHSALAFNHEVSLLFDNHKMANELLSYIAAIK